MIFRKISVVYNTEINSGLAELVAGDALLMRREKSPFLVRIQRPEPENLLDKTLKKSYKEDVI